MELTIVVHGMKVTVEFDDTTSGFSELMDYARQIWEDTTDESSTFKEEAESHINKIIIHRLLIDGIGPERFLDPYTYSATCDEIAQEIMEIAYAGGYNEVFESSLESCSEYIPSDYEEESSHEDMRESHAEDVEEAILRAEYEECPPEKEMKLKNALYKHFAKKQLK